ncbi:hypothetical protein HWV62_24464 [Athelia sp. TMB]|nr:hypothetical protein HWV62_24464 [Athelia sp. TMB]
MPSQSKSLESTRPSGWKAVVKRLECPVDEDATYKNDRWTNRDLIPIPPQRRTYKIWSYFIYWCISGSNVSAYTTGSSLLAYGLNAQQAMACVVIGSLIAGMVSYLVNFGGFEAVLTKYLVPPALSGVWLDGGGSPALGALIPGFAHMKNTIPLSSHITTNDLVGTLIWYLLYIPLILVPPERLQRPFVISAVALTCTLLGLTIWSVHTNGGGGPLFHTPNTAANTSWSMIFGITSILGSWGSGTLGQSDWTRYASRRYAPTLSQMVAAPVTITLTALLGVVVTSASSNILGELYWSPITLLGAILDHYNFSSGARAGVFFGGVGVALSQLSLNVILNSVSTGMDIAGLWPRFINIRRGILLADYLVVRKRTLVVEDLYIGDSRSIYWYQHGIHWRAALAWAMGTWPTFPGFIISLQDPLSDSNWAKLFKIAFFDDSIVLAKDGQNRESTTSTASVEDMDEKVPVESEA